MQQTEAFNRLARAIERLLYMVIFLLTMYFMNILTSVYEHIRNEVLASLYQAYYYYFHTNVTIITLNILSLIATIPLLIFELWLFYIALKWLFLEAIIQQIKVD